MGETVVRRDEDGAADPVLEAVRGILTEIGEGNEAAALSKLEELAGQREREGNRDFARFAGDLRDILSRFRLDLRVSELTLSELPDAREQLAYVVRKTEEAAHRTLSAIEGTLSDTDHLQGESEKLEAKIENALAAGGSESQTALREARIFLGDLGETRARIGERLTDALLAQDFQDLTGQVIKRVAGLVEELENQLRGVAGSQAALPDSRDGCSDTEPEGPFIGSREQTNRKTEFVSDQGEVDDLLGTLGL